MEEDDRATAVRLKEHLGGRARSHLLSRECDRPGVGGAEGGELGDEPRVLPLQLPPLRANGELAPSEQRQQECRGGGQPPRAAAARGGAPHTFDEPLAHLARGKHGIETQRQERRRASILVARATARKTCSDVQRQHDRVSGAGDSERVECRDRFGLFVRH